jgi:cobyrinic acid a,c-diamide synthase
MTKKRHFAIEMGDRAQPIGDSTMPPADALWLPGGYPELHLDALAHNPSMIAWIRAHHAAGKAIVAECGGMLYLLDSLADVRGRRASLVGLMPGRRPCSHDWPLGLQAVSMPEGSLRGHSFHFSRSRIRLDPLASGRCPNGEATAEAVYRKGSLTASYMHFYFPSNPLAVARLFSR